MRYGKIIPCSPLVHSSSKPSAQGPPVYLQGLSARKTHGPGQKWLALSAPALEGDETTNDDLSDHSKPPAPSTHFSISSPRHASRRLPMNGTQSLSSRRVHGSRLASLFSEHALCVRSLRTFQPSTIRQRPATTHRPGLTQDSVHVNVPVIDDHRSRRRGKPTNGRSLSQIPVTRLALFPILRGSPAR